MKKASHGGLVWVVVLKLKTHKKGFELELGNGIVQQLIVVH